MLCRLSHGTTTGFLAARLGTNLLYACLLSGTHSRQEGQAREEEEARTGFEKPQHHDMTANKIVNPQQRKEQTLLTTHKASSRPRGSAIMNFSRSRVVSPEIQGYKSAPILLPCGKQAVAYSATNSCA